MGKLERFGNRMRLQKLGSNLWQMWSKKQKCRQELIPNTQFQPCRVFVSNDLVKKQIRSRRIASKQFLELKKKVWIIP